MTITEEDFEAWRGNPVTEAVFAAVKKVAEDNKEQWMSLSWDGGQADPATLMELRAIAQANMDLVTIGYEAIASENEKPERDKSG